MSGRARLGGADRWATRLIAPASRGFLSFDGDERPDDRHLQTWPGHPLGTVHRDVTSSPRWARC